MQKDKVEAVKWYRKAAEQGFANAQTNLGTMYYNGEGVPKDLVQAHAWWNIAGSARPKKKTQAGGIDPGCVSVPTPAELDYQQNGIILPQKAQNLEKLLTDYEKTGKFDYELCYLLRKQEAQEDLKQWIGRVIQKRRLGDAEFGKEVDTMHFNDLAESVKQRAAGKPLFREAFERSLQESLSA